MQINLRKTWHQVRWLLAAAAVPIIAIAGYLVIDAVWPGLGDPWITIERVQATWRPKIHEVEIFRVYVKNEPCPGILGWDVSIKEAGSSLVRGPFRRYTTTTQIGKRIYGTPIEVPLEFQNPPLRVGLEVYCVEVTDDGLVELNAEYPPQRAEAWVPVSGSGTAQGLGNFARGAGPAP